MVVLFTTLLLLVIEALIRDFPWKYSRVFEDNETKLLHLFLKPYETVALCIQNDCNRFTVRIKFHKTFSSIDVF